MKTKVNQTWYNQELKALNWQVSNAPKHIKFQKKRIEILKKGNNDCVGCTIEQVQGFLKEAIKEQKNAPLRLLKFKAKYQPCETIKSNWKGAEAFIQKNAHMINSSPGVLRKTKSGKNVWDKWDYYQVISVISEKFGLPMRSDSSVDRIFSILDKHTNGGY